METDLKKKLQGFTLIELIMTIVLLGIVAIPSSAFLIESIRGAFKSADIIMAVNLARMELEKTTNMAYADISTITYNNYERYNYDLNREVSYLEGGSPPAEGVIEIKVQVYPAGELGSAEDLLTTVMTHRTSYAE